MASVKLAESAGQIVSKVSSHHTVVDGMEATFNHTVADVHCTAADYHTATDCLQIRRNLALRNIVHFLAFAVLLILLVRKAS